MIKLFAQAVGLAVVLLIMLGRCCAYGCRVAWRGMWAAHLFLCELWLAYKQVHADNLSRAVIGSEDTDQSGARP